MTSRVAATAFCWALAVTWAIWALIRLVGIEAGYPLVPLIAYTPYVAVAAVIPIAIGMSLRRWAPAALSAVAGIYLVLAVLPRALPDGGASQRLGGPTLSVVSANTHLGEARFLDLIRLARSQHADILNVQELTPAGALGLRRLGIGATLPYAVLAIQTGASGGGIYSRYPLRPLPPANGTGVRMPRAVVKVPHFGSLRIVDVHPLPPNSWQGVDDWRSGLRSLPSAEHGGPPWVLAGDFNATLDQAELQRVLGHGFRDAADVRGAGLKMTWPVGRTIPPPVAIDHVLADKRISVIDFGVDDLPGSDHRAVHAKLSLPGAPAGPSG